MPIYEYRCTRCGDQTEVLQRVSEAPKRRCGKCSGRLEKLVSRTSFHLKGGGWFSEGYSRGTGKPETPSKTGADAKSKTGSESKSPSKPSEKKASSA